MFHLKIAKAATSIYRGTLNYSLRKLNKKQQAALDSYNEERDAIAYMQMQLSVQVADANQKFSEKSLKITAAINEVENLQDAFANAGEIDIEGVPSDD